jgi:hypothetical protein
VLGLNFAFSSQIDAEESGALSWFVDCAIVAVDSRLHERCSGFCFGDGAARKPIRQS